MSELKPVRCGCGGEARVILINEDVYAVECSKCWIRTHGYAPTEAEAVEAWNRAMGATDTNVGDKNDPLTWDELKAMVGKPVWVEHKHYSKWLIVYEVYENTIVLDGNGCYTQYFSDDNDEEVRWQAYRKERG